MKKCNLCYDRTVAGAAAVVRAGLPDPGALVRRLRGVRRTQRRGQPVNQTGFGDAGGAHAGLPRAAGGGGRSSTSRRCSTRRGPSSGAERRRARRPGCCERRADQPTGRPASAEQRGQVSAGAPSSRTTGTPTTWSRAASCCSFAVLRLRRAVRRHGGAGGARAALGKPDARQPTADRPRRATCRRARRSTSHYPRAPTTRRCCCTCPAASFVAYSQKCTHLSCAVYYQPERERLYCPCHEGVFDPVTGEPVAGPPQRRLADRPAQDGDTLYAVGHVP